jgi:hypothetical protein|tara:strand:+ start:595 stop:837 length:243 start_codon:yes stop_codon:yes gene_type:complete
MSKTKKTKQSRIEDLIKMWKNRKFICDKIDLSATTKEQLMFCIKISEGFLQNQSATVKHLRNIITWQQEVIDENRKNKNG